MPYALEIVEDKGNTFYRIVPDTGPGKKVFNSEAEAQLEVASLNKAEQDLANDAPDDEEPSPTPSGPKRF